MSGCTGQASEGSVTIGQIVRQFGLRYMEQYNPSKRVLKVLNDIANCRTGALGGHYVKCVACDYEAWIYNSCGNSNCPQCQSLKREFWIDKMVHHLLPIKHFHVIFTVPHQLNELFFYNQEKMYKLLFKSAWETISKVTGVGLSGMVCTLHTWGSNLSYHPHLHCIVPKGSLIGQEWKMDHLYRAHFFVKVEVLRAKFKEIFLNNLVDLIDYELLYMGGKPVDDENFHLLRAIFDQVKKIKQWSLRIEAPVCGTQQIIEYLGRYVKRVAITNSRILEVNDAVVRFSYNIYAKQEKGKAAPKGVKQLAGEKFLQQFCQHILPRYFQRVRYYGIYGFTNKKRRAQAYRSITQQSAPDYKKPLKRQLIKKMLGTDPDVCPDCGAYCTLTLNLLLDVFMLRFRLGDRWYNPSVKLRPRAKNIVI